MIKKIIFAALTTFLFHNAVFSQTEKGRFTLSGKTDLGYLLSRSEIKQDSISMDSFKEKSFKANLGFAWFVANNFSIGISGSVQYNRENADNLSGYRQNVIAGVIPALTYYLPVPGKLKPGISAGAGYMWVYEDRLDLKGITLNAAPSISYFPNRNLSFDLGLQYSHNTLKNSYPGQPDQTQNIFGLLAGLSVYF